MTSVGLDRAPRKRHSGLPSVSVIRQRIRAFQALCSAEREALVFIAGVDGKFNDGARKALNYLLYGCSGNEVYQDSRNNPELEELLIVISGGSCFLHVGTTAVHERLLPLTGEIAGLQLFTIPDDEAADMDLAEERKIMTFLEMIEVFENVGTELTPSQSGGAASDKDMAMEVESWPLIQVYGVEELGNRGFFTMRHKVQDVGPLLTEVYRRLDKHAAETVATNHVDMLAYHWETALAVLDMHLAYERQQLSEKTIAEPLLSFYQYGMLRSEDSEDQEQRRPRVSIGVRTNDRRACNGAAIVNKSGEDGKAAIHFVLEAAEPNGPIQLARTYFLSNGGAATRLRAFDWDGNEEELKDNALARSGRSATARCLMTAYSALVSAHAALVDAFCAGRATDDKALQRLAAEHLAAAHVDWFRDLDFAANLSARLTATDLMGCPADPAPASKHVKYLRLELRHILSLDKTPTDLGAVVYGDCFIDGPAKTGVYLPLTAPIQKLAAWMGGEQEEDTRHQDALLSRLRASKKHVHSTMGPLVYDDALLGVRLQSSVAELAPQTGNLWVLEKGLIYTAHRLGSVAVDFTHHVASADFYHTHDTVVLRLKEGFTLYGVMETCGAVLELTLSPGAVDRKVFGREVLHAWRETLQGLNIQTSLLETPPPQAGHRAHSETEEICVNDASSSHFADFLSNYDLSDADVKHEGSRAAAAGGGGWPVIAIVGQPGLDKRKLVKAAAQLSDARCEVVWYQNPAAPTEVDGGALSNLLLKEIPGAPKRDGTDRAVVLVVSTYAGAPAVASAVASCPGVSLERMSVVVNATSFMRAGSSAVDALVSAQCSPGFVSNVVLVNTEQCRPDQISAIQHQLRYINPRARLIRAVAGRVTSGDDIERLLVLSEDDEGRFTSHEMAQARVTVLPTWDAMRGKPPADVWSARRGGISQITFPLLSETTFVRTHLVMAIRGLFTANTSSLERYVEAGRNGAKPMELFHLTACLRVAKTDKQEEGHKADFSVLKAKRGFVTVTPSAEGQSCASVTISGRNLDSTTVVRALLTGRTPLPQPTPLRTAADLTKDEKRKIKADHISEPLPEGFFFNGVNYVDFSGTTHEFHPHMDGLIEQYLEKENDGLSAKNVEIKRQQAAADKELEGCLAMARQALSSR